MQAVLDLFWPFSFSVHCREWGDIYESHIRYTSEATVDKHVYKNLKKFLKNKEAGDSLFDRLNTSVRIIIHI